MFGKYSPEAASVNQSCRLLIPYESIASEVFLLRSLDHPFGNKPTWSRHSLYEAGRGDSLSLPPLPEQTAIVRFLDHITTNVDTAISNSCRLIDLLKEYRTRLIADVVTGKLDMREAAAELLEADPIVNKNMHSAERVTTHPNLNDSGIFQKAAP